MIRMIPYAAEKHLDWIALTDALAAGHALPKAEIADVFLYQGDRTLLNRSAWIAGLGMAVKCATVFPGNPAQGRAMVNGAVNLLSDETGMLEAILDFALVTKWKTAGDSLLAARRLARPDSRKILIVGAGTVGRALWQAYGAAFPQARFAIWNRSPGPARDFAAACPGTEPREDLQAAVAEADIVTVATMSSVPLIRGAWLQPGQHIDLIGAYRPDMREADDLTLQRGRLFVDSFDTTLDHIGELRIPLASGAISRPDVLADFADLARFVRHDANEITVFKNGGGAHLDLMTSRYILGAVPA